MYARILLAAALAALALPVGSRPLYAQPAPSDITVLRPEDLVRAVRQPVPADTALTLAALLKAVRANNPALEAARLRAAALAQRPEQVSALPDPSAMVTYQPRPILTARGYQRSQLGLTQRIPFPGKLALKGDIAALNAAVAGLEASAYGLDLALQTKRAFYKLYRIQEQSRIIRAFQEQLEGFEEIAATQYAVGQGPQQAILKAQLERNRLARRLLNLSEARRTAALELARLTGRSDASALLSGAVRLERPDVEMPVMKAAQRALARRPEVQARQTQIEQASAQIDLAQKQFWPDFTVGVTYFDLGATELTPMMTGRDALAVSVGIKIPLWRGKLRANVEEARLQRRRAEARYQDLQVQIKTQIQDLLNQVETEERTLKLYRETLIPQAETTLEATLSAYTTGRADFLDLLDAERTLFQLTMSYEETLNRYLDATAALARALGMPLSEVDTP